MAEKDGRREGFNDLEAPVKFSVTYINHAKHNEQRNGDGSSLLRAGSSLSAGSVCGTRLEALTSAKSSRWQPLPAACNLGPCCSPRP